MSFCHAWIEGTAAVAVAASLGATGAAWFDRAAPLPPAPETVVVAAGTFGFEPTGEFVRGGAGYDPGERRVTLRRPVEIMKHQVGLGEYRACVDDGRCEPPEARTQDPDAPVTGVSFLDAGAYADWLSERRGETWRLPTAEEWAHVAAERFAGEVFSRGDDPDNPAVAWLRRYEEQVLFDREADPIVHPRGHFGPNSNGVHDIGGNVWEWTSACYTRTADDSAGGASRYENCGIRVAEGAHRAYMTAFIRDGRSGGCAVGTPPDHLGFRLVREDDAFPFLAALRSRIAAAFDR
ncbi:formylglycine-generating enzyme family protein [Oricola thermophila]|uniref:SUMF1/EgtB/PvdO family nonheme iron enzyme n=1 Tax=Oricola thermophila TaxID=2742145 RepID=A0A6N1VHL7_9HYPH|nr:formylglycine-generating enzyme family protein [Oricola thermophila]QKV18649.1 SUMF1/EgtB/PvdO family nonheme iron enzyme [Oricola thermophila]